MKKLHKFLWFLVFFIPCWVIWSLVRSFTSYWSIHNEVYEGEIAPKESKQVNQ